MPKTPTIERAAELLLRAQLAARRGGDRGVLLEEVRREWGVSKPTLRRVVRHLMAVAAREGFERLGTLSRPHVPRDPGRAGRPASPRLVWTPVQPISRRVLVPTRGPAVDNIPLSQAFMGELACAPFELAAEGVFANVFGPLVDGLPKRNAGQLDELRRRGHWYQPAVHRRIDPDVANECVSAVLHRNLLEIGDYRSPNRDWAPQGYEFAPWTLVQSYDGLYVLGRPTGAPPSKPPQLLALHRMGAARRLRGTTQEIPENFDPATFLGHGYGPYVGQPGETLLFVPDDEWKFVQEMEVASERARRPVPGGWEVELATGFNHGLRLWCRWEGIRIVESTGMPDWVSKQQVAACESSSDQKAP